MDRWNFLFVAGTVASLFVAIFSSVISAFVIKRRRAAQDRRIAECRKSPYSRLLRLND
jgi:hypothetical protein